MVCQKINKMLRNCVPLKMSCVPALSMWACRSSIAPPAPYSCALLLCSRRLTHPRPLAAPAGRRKGAAMLRRTQIQMPTVHPVLVGEESMTRKKTTKGRTSLGTTSKSELAPRCCQRRTAGSCHIATRCLHNSDSALPAETTVTWEYLTSTTGSTLRTTRRTAPLTQRRELLRSETWRSAIEGRGAEEEATAALQLHTMNLMVGQAEAGQSRGIHVSHPRTTRFTAACLFAD